MSCDCIPGKFQCKEAMYLWSEVNRLYQSGLYPGDTGYDRAAKVYRDHVNAVENERKDDVYYQYVITEGE